jgi:hypothetical protein
MTVAAAVVPSMNLDVEHALLGGAMQPDVGREIFALLAAVVHVEDFATDAHRAVFAAMLALHRDGHPVDQITLAASLRARDDLDVIGGPAKIAQLFEAGLLAVPAVVPTYIERLLEDSTKRTLQQLGGRVTHGASNGSSAAEVLDDVTATIEGLRRRIAGQRPDGESTLGQGLGQFLAREFSPTVSYIEELMSDDGGGWIAGEEKLGKTYWALSEGLALATGETLAGRFKVPQARKVLFLEEEDSPRRAHRRLRALVRGLKYDPDDALIQDVLDRQFLIDVWGGFSLDSPVMLARLETTIAGFRPEVVYIDVLRKVTVRALKDEQAMGQILAALDDLRRRYGVVFRIVHHFRKVQGFRTGRGSQELGGSFVLGAWAENSVYLEPIGRKQGAVRLTVQCKDLPPAPEFLLRLEFEGPPHDPEVVRTVVEVVAEPPGLPEVDEAVYQAIATCPAVHAVHGHPGVPLAALMAATKKSNATIRRALDRLIDAGRILLTGTMSKQKKLYGVKRNDDA